MGLNGRQSFQAKGLQVRKLGGFPPYFEADYLRGVHDTAPCVKLREDFRRLPQLNASIGVATNLDFEILGTNAADADCTFRVGGGITLATHGSTNDSTILCPHLDTNQTAWAVASWLSQKSPRFEAIIETSASVAAQTFWAGLKKTNTPVVATDADQAFFRFSTAYASNATKLHFVTSRSDVDTDDALSLTIAASTQYRLVIDIDSNLFPHIYVNGRDYTKELSSAGKAALTTAIPLYAFTGILQTGASAKSLSILPGYEIGRAA